MIENPYNFVWILGDVGEEIRYSIRSVLKYHPDANIVIIGSKPDWYKGEHYYLPDDDIAFKNKWRKTLKACELFDSFIQMDDDFYLLEPYKPNLYYDGLLIKRNYNGRNRYGRMVSRSIEQNPKARNYLLHTPLPVISDLYPKDITDASPRQTYCDSCNEFEEVDIKDVKFPNRLGIKGLPFFSIDDNFESVKGKLQELYPDSCELEIN